MPELLDTPGDEDALYLDRGQPVDSMRPVMTGDVFDGPTIPGCSAHALVIVLSHPCSLRRGVDLVDSVQALPIARYHDVSVAAWERHVRVMPLPNMLLTGDHFAARLTEFGMVPANQLNLDHRRCTLSERAVVLLQQRFFHNQSRVKVPLERLFEASAPVFEEVALWERWNDDRARPRVEAGDDREAVLNDEGHSFDAVLRGELEPGLTLRDALRQPARRAAVRRAVAAAAKHGAADV